MGWLSRLLGEMHEETKYKPSSGFKVKDTGDKAIITKQPLENYQSKSAAKLFIKSYQEKQKPKIDPLEALFSEGSPFRNLEQKMMGLNNIENSIPNEKLEQANKLVIMGVIAFIVFIGLITSFASNNNSGLINLIFWIIIIGIMLAVKAKKKSSHSPFY